jgi:hypothetical protein
VHDTAANGEKAMQVVQEPTAEEVLHKRILKAVTTWVEGFGTPPTRYYDKFKQLAAKRKAMIESTGIDVTERFAAPIADKIYLVVEAEMESCDAIIASMDFTPTDKADAVKAA